MSYQSVFKPALFAGQVIVVTGGGSGIGRCTAHELAALGAHVVLVGRNLEKLQNTATEIVADGGRASYHACDIRDEEAVKSMVQAIVATQGRVHALVNNAGGQFIQPLEKISAKGWQAVIDTNLTGGFLVARECYVQSMQQHGGSIVNIVADMWGLDARHGPQRRGPRWHGELYRNGCARMGAKRRARERGGTGLHCIERHGPLPARGWPHAARDGANRARRPFWHRSRNLGRDCVFCYHPQQHL